ncbi:hypothetical protein PENSPDRAFT_584497 [Peniophora sp. CONT]|nr:hypothetical protein PENSPDRAFT_584497 [Peniophora sp. CONT]
MTRTPSPTPSEVELLTSKGFMQRPKLRDLPKYLHRKYIVNWIIAIALIAITVVSFALHDQIVDWLKPFGDKVKALPAGWLIPVAFLIVLSFPPLFGHEFVAIICGVVWGLGPGFGIVALGTLLGEIANYFVFRFLCSARGEKLEKTNLKYGLLSYVVRREGFFRILMIRLSAIPPHFTTIIFGTVKMNFFIFLAAAILSLPRQFATVYLGVLAAEDKDKETKGQKIATIIVIVGTILMTILSMRYVNHKIDVAKPDFVYARRKERQAGVQAGDVERAGHAPASSVDVLLTPQPKPARLSDEVRMYSGSGVPQYSAPTYYVSPSGPPPRRH